MKNKLLMLLFSLLLLSAAACRQTPDGAQTKVNVVLVTLDTLRADHLGCYGYRPAHTPVLDAFASSGQVFENATTVSSNTLPSHAAILCGRHPRRIGVPRNGFEVPPGQRSLAVLFKENGYRTAAIVSCSVLDATSGLRRGFDTYDDSFDIEEMDQSQRRAPETVRRALAWLDKNAQAPFFLWVHLFDPHYPYTPPPPYDRLYFPEYSGKADGSIPFIFGIQGRHGFVKTPTRPEDYRRLTALYDGEIAFMDASLAPFFAYLDRAEVRKRTAVVVVADHGESLTEHDYFFDHGLDVYQPSMHVPLMTRIPKQKPGRRIATAVQTIDIFPTLLRQTGLSIPADTEGRDATPLLLGAEKKSGFVSFGEACQPHEVEVRGTNEWRNDRKAQFALLLPWKLIWTPYSDRIELYRLDSDPDEMHNVAAANPHMVSWLQKELQSWRRGSAAPAQRPNPANLDKIRSLGYL